jgi:superfamily II DNA or RNA helicase
VEYTNEDAVKDKVINPFEIIFVKFDMDKNPKGIKVEYTKNKEKRHFYQSENQAYNYAHNQFIEAYSNYKQSLFDLAMNTGSKQDFIKAEAIMKIKRNARTNLLYNSIASRETAKKLIKAILDKDKTNKVVCFSKRTAQSDSISSFTFHGKNSKKVNEENYDKFISGEIRELCAASKIDRGVSIPNLNNIILESFDSSATTLTQRFGRTQRLDIKNTSRVYIMLPYYMKEVGSNQFESAETQAVTWAKKALAEYDISTAKVIDLRAAK